MTPVGVLVTVAVTVTVTAVVSAVHLFAAADAVAPVWMDDEVGYLAGSRLLAGVGAPLSLDALGYYAGWPVVLAPLWWLSEDPGTVYRLAVLAAVLAGVLLVWPLAALARRLGVRPPWAVVAAGVLAAAPDRTVTSGYALAENFLALVVALLALAALRFAENPTPARALAVAGCAAYAFFTHGRAAPLVVATLVWFAAVLIGRGSATGRATGRARRAAAVGLAAVVGLSLLAHVTNRLLIARLYDADVDREGAALQGLLTLDPAGAATGLVGQVWYQVAAWAGLPLLGLLVVARRAAAEVRGGAVGVACWAALLTAGTVLISVSAVSDPVANGALRVDRADIYAYGRYVAPVMVVLALVGLAAVLARVRLARRWEVVATPLLAAAVVAVFLALVVPQVPAGAVTMPINVPGLMSWSWSGITAPPDERPWLAASAAGLSLCVATVALQRARWLLVGVLCLASVGASVQAEVATLRVFDRPWHAQPHLLKETVRALDLGPVSYDSVGSEAVGRNGYQFWLTPAATPVFDSTEEPAPTDVVMARKDWPAAERLGARLVVGDPRLDEALYVLPGREQQRLRRLGALAPPAGAPLPEAAKDYELTVADPAGLPSVVERADPPVVEVAVTHTGAGAPWAAIGTMARDLGAVRLVLWWQVPDDEVEGGQLPQIVDLPRSLVPGETVTLTVPLAPPSQVPEGVTTVRVGLVEEGRGGFDPPGQEPLTLRVYVEGALRG